MNHLLESLPSCFSNPSNRRHRPTKPTSKMPQNLVTSVYQASLCDSPTTLTFTWSRTSSAHSLTINVDSFSFSISLSPPSTFSFFAKKPGSKTLPLAHHHHHCRRPHKLLWDFSRARFADSSAEPVSNFYLAVVHDGEIEFLLGEVQEEAGRRKGVQEPRLLSRREHVFGRRSFATRAKFPGSTATHDIRIECSGGALRVAVDGAVGLVVKRLAWKFRGNERIVVGGADVEFYWDVFNWVSGAGGESWGHGVFAFQVGEGGVWTEMAAQEKKLMGKKSCSAASPGQSSPGSWSVMQWSEERSEGWRSCGSSSASSRCSSSSSSAVGGNRGGFSLLLYAWDLD